MFRNTDTEASKWSTISNKAQIDDIIQQSKKRYQLVYKHSHRCGVSLFAKAALEEVDGKIHKTADMYMVDVIKSRDVSNAIETKFNIRHESPQVLLIKDGKVVWNASHGRVKGAAILEQLPD